MMAVKPCALRLSPSSAISFLLLAYPAENGEANRLSHFSGISHHAIFKNDDMNDTLQTSGQIGKDVLRCCPDQIADRDILRERGQYHSRPIAAPRIPHYGADAFQGLHQPMRTRLG